jgi:tRNA pseudouridine55 synthase
MRETAEVRSQMTSKTPLKSEGILLIDKPSGCTSFDLVRHLRKLTKISKIGHAGTLDPFATGLMVMLIGRTYTKKSALLMSKDKAYRATLKLGCATTTFDPEGEVTATSDLIPDDVAIKTAISEQQGEKEQIPPMFSAKKVGGKRLYTLARKGIEIERKPSLVKLKTTLISYTYPELVIDVECSKGTYIRTIADEIGKSLGCYAHLKSLVRTRSGDFSLDDAKSIEALKEQPDIWHMHLRHLC